MGEDIKCGVYYADRENVSAPNNGTEKVIVGMKFPKPEPEEKTLELKMPKPIIGNTVPTGHNIYEAYDAGRENQYTYEQAKGDEGGNIIPDSMSQHMATVSLQLNQNTHAVETACTAMVEGVQEIQKQLQSSNRAPRKEITAYSGSEISNYDIMAKIEYDNATFQNVRLIENAHGPIKVAQLTMDSEKVADLYAIWFSDFAQVITGRIDGLTRSKLHQEFIKAGIKFNKQLPQTKIPDIVFEMFSPAISLSDDTILVPACGGWFQKQYLHKFNFPYGKGRALAKLPVMTKKICMDELTHEDIQFYQKELSSIVNTNDRKIIALYPFVAILASILEAAGKKVDKVLNIVPYESAPLERVCRWFSVSEHERYVPVHGNGCENAFLEKCTSVKDEVLMIDFRKSNQGSKYKRGNARGNQSILIGTFAGTHSLAKPINPCGIVMFSESLYPGKNVVNILLGRKSIEKVSTPNHVIAKVFGAFIKYAENNHEHVREIINRKRNPQFDSSGIFGSTLEVLNYFWASKGYSTWDILGTRINGSDFRTLLKNNVFDVEELFEKFFRAMRKDAGRYKILALDDKTDSDVCIRYEQRWIWIPTSIFNEVCTNNGLAAYAAQIVLAYEALGFLKPDTTSKSIVKQVCNRRYEAYCFKANTFDRTGWSAFINLGSEGGV